MPDQTASAAPAANTPTSGAPTPKAPGVSSQTVGSPSTTPKAPGAADGNGLAPASGAPASATPASTGSAVAPPDLKLTVEQAKELQQKAKWEKQVREREAKVAEDSKRYERFQKFDELVEAGDALGALKVLKDDAFVDKVLRRLNEQIIAEGEPESPAEAARKAVQAELKKQADDAKAADERAENDARTPFLATADRYLDVEAGKHPYTLRALATGKLAKEKIWDVAKAMHARDGNVTYQSLFEYIEGQLAPPPPPPPPPAEDPKPAPASSSVADLNATATPGDDEAAGMTKEEFKEHLKRKMGITNKPRPGGYW
jgi:hypothetical protein